MATFPATESPTVEQLSHERLFELYVDTVSRCTSRIRELPDEEILYHLFEEFDIGAQSFLYPDSLQRLLSSELITQAMVDTSTELRNAWIEFGPKPWTVEEIRNNQAWRELFDKGDALVECLRARVVTVPTHG